MYFNNYKPEEIWWRNYSINISNEEDKLDQYSHSLLSVHGLRMWILKRKGEINLETERNTFSKLMVSNP